MCFYRRRFWDGGNLFESSAVCGFWVDVHPWKPTWIPKMKVWKRHLTRFKHGNCFCIYVRFLGCIKLTTLKIEHNIHIKTYRGNIHTTLKFKHGRPDNQCLEKVYPGKFQFTDIISSHHLGPWKLHFPPKCVIPKRFKSRYGLKKFPQNYFHGVKILTSIPWKTTPLKTNMTMEHPHFQ